MMNNNNNKFASYFISFISHHYHGKASSSCLAYEHAQNILYHICKAYFQNNGDSLLGGRKDVWIYDIIHVRLKVQLQTHW